MTYAVLVRVDGAGPWPVILREGEEMLSEEGVRWRWVAETDDIEEAPWVRDALHRRLQAGEL